MISSTLVTCWTGKSPGFSPLRIRPRILAGEMCDSVNFHRSSLQERAVVHPSEIRSPMSQMGHQRPVDTPSSVARCPRFPEIVEDDPRNVGCTELGQMI